MSTHISVKCFYTSQRVSFVVLFTVLKSWRSHAGLLNNWVAEIVENEELLKFVALLIFFVWFQFLRHVFAKWLIVRFGGWEAEVGSAKGRQRSQTFRSWSEAFSWPLCPSSLLLVSSKSAATIITNSLFLWAEQRLQTFPPRRSLHTDVFTMATVARMLTEGAALGAERVSEIDVTCFTERAEVMSESSALLIRNSSKVKEGLWFCGGPSVMETFVCCLR